LRSAGEGSRHSMTGVQRSEKNLQEGISDYYPATRLRFKIFITIRLGMQALNSQP